MTNNQLKNKLQAITNMQENSMQKTIANKLLDNSSYQIIFSLETIDIKHAVHFISPIMKTSDYHTFFDNHYSEIEELRLYIENDNNIKLNLQYNFDLKTQLSIFAISNIICKFNRELKS